MEYIETFLREYNSVEETRVEEMGFFYVSSDEIKELDLQEEPIQEEPIQEEPIQEEF